MNIQFLFPCISYENFFARFTCSLISRLLVGTENDHDSLIARTERTGVQRRLRLTAETERGADRTAGVGVAGRGGCIMRNLEPRNCIPWLRNNFTS